MFYHFYHQLALRFLSSSQRNLETRLINKYDVLVIEEVILKTIIRKNEDIFNNMHRLKKIRYDKSLKFIFVRKKPIIFFMRNFCR